MRALPLLLAAALVGCGSSASQPTSGGTIKLRSQAFSPGGAIPTALTCDGVGSSPPLQWSGVPGGTAELALTVEDLDAPGRPFIHWAISGLDPRATGLAAGAPPAGAVQGRNDFGRVGYGRPCPPSGGKRHRYSFVLYALRSSLGLQPGFRLSRVGTSLARDTLATGELIGTYRR
jgi:hypothetical protein